jgi:hypothetical protein
VTQVDWDLLADHLGGALAGTTEGARVADLVATDPLWAQAAARLSTAFGAVADDLAALPAPALPDDVAARLDAALLTVTRVPPAGRATPAAAPGAPGPAPRRPANGRRRPPGRPAARRRRAARWGSGLAVGLAAIGFAAVGINGLDLTGGDGGERGVASPADDQAAAPPLGTGGQPRLLASGADYSRTGLSQPGSAPLFGLEGDRQEGAPGVVGQPPAVDGDADPVPEALAHLWPRPDSCLAAVRQAYTPAPAVVEAVDFAFFEGEPALLIWLLTGDGDRWVSVAGAGCGTAGADERHRVKVG